MNKLIFQKKHAGQGMTEYIIIVALIAIAAIGVYTAFGSVVKAQTSVAASSLAGAGTTPGRTEVTAEAAKASTAGTKATTLKNFEQ